VSYDQRNKTQKKSTVKRDGPVMPGFESCHKGRLQ